MKFFLCGLWIGLLAIRRFWTKDISDDAYTVSLSILFATLYIAEVLYGR